jgi:hypothetical protein
MAFHIDQGSYGGVSLDDLNVALAFRTPGRRAKGTRPQRSTSTTGPMSNSKRRFRRSLPDRLVAR